MVKPSEERAEDASYRITQLFCHRVRRFLPPEEHVRCSYCHGGEAGVAVGLHSRFCDYVRGRDPVHFGFPEQAERDLEG